MVVLHIKCNYVVVHILPADPLYLPTAPYPQILVKGPLVKIQLFQNMVMLHIKLKGITKCSIIVANILPAAPLNLPVPHPRKGSTGLNIVMLNIKLTGITNAATWHQMFCPQTPLSNYTRGRGIKVKIHLFQNMVLLHSKFKKITNVAT